MATIIPDNDQRRAARIAGAAYLLSFIMVLVVTFAVQGPILVENNATETARNVLANESLFRLGIVGDMIHSAALVVLVGALYVVLLPVDRTLATLAAALRMVYAGLWVLICLNLVIGLRLVRGGEYLGVFPEDQLHALGRLYFSGYYAYYVGLMFWGLASTITSYLFWKSSYMPRALAAIGIAGSAFAAFCGVAFIASPDFANYVNVWAFDTPLALFELASGIYLTFKGLRTPAAQPA